jgi:hypothetical protein
LKLTNWNVAEMSGKKAKMHESMNNFCKWLQSLLLPAPQINQWFIQVKTNDKSNRKNVAMQQI